MASLTPNRQDTLNLATSPQCARMVAKIGENFPDPEHVIGSGRVVKINRKGKQQSRVLLITDKALYNLLPHDFSKCKRRITYGKIAGISTSTTSDEFAIHVPEEYDYHFAAPAKQMMIDTICECYRIRVGGGPLTVRRVVQGSLRATIVTKDMARLQTREERLKRYQEFVNTQVDDDSDVEDTKDDEASHSETIPAGGGMSGNGGVSHSQARVGEISHDTNEDDLDISTLLSGNGNWRGVSADPSLSNEAPITIEAFEFLKVLGRGSFAKVMLVRKKDDGEIFAMKILKKKYLIQRQQVEHTISERKILESLRHPFLMKLRYAFQTSGKLYFVLDYYQGGELFYHLKKRRRFTEEESRFFVAEVGCALGHLHSMDVIYRDLKPENILLDHDGHVCLTDFGLSKDLGKIDDPAEKMSHTFCGTPEYLAPEIILNLGHNKAVDWWSLGILLYELCVGIPPFYSQNVNEMYRKIREAPLLFPPTLSNECKDVISNMLRRDPANRLGSSDRDWDEIKEHNFFSDFLDFDDLLNKRLEPPYKPNENSPRTKQFDVDELRADTSHFDKTFTQEPVVDSYVDASTLATPDATAFDGFTFAEQRGAL